MWPFRRKKSEHTFTAPPAAPETERTDWSTLPALPVTLEPLTLTLDTKTFEPGLSTRRDPELFLAPLEHDISEEAPEGTVEGLVTVIPGRKSESPPPQPPPQLVSTAPPSSPARPQSSPSAEPETAADVGRGSIPALTLDAVEGHLPTVVIPPPQPLLTVAPLAEHPVPKLDLPPKRTEAAATREDRSPVSPQALEIGEPEVTEPVRSRPTVGKAPEIPRRVGLGEPLPQKPVKPAEPAQPPEPAVPPTALESKASAPTTPAPAELVLPPQRVEPQETLSVPAPPESPGSQPEQPPPPSPQPAPTPVIKASEDQVAPRRTVETARRPPRLPVTRTKPRTEVRPTLAGVRPSLQRQIVDASPNLPGTQVRAVPRRPKGSAEQDALETPPKPRPSAVERVVPLRRLPPTSAPLVAFKRETLPKESSGMPVAVLEPPPQTRAEDSPLPAAKVDREPALEYRPQFPSPPKATPAAVAPPAPQPAASSPPAAAAQAAAAITSDSLVTVQRAASPAPPPSGSKSGTEWKAEEIYEQVRTRLRKEFRMYREQAGLSTYRG